MLAAEALRGGGAALASRERARLCLWRQARPEQRLADIDVAKPGNDALIEQKGFERLRLAWRALRQIGRRKRVRQRLHAKVFEMRMRRPSRHVEQRHIAEAARIVVADRCAAAHGENHVVVARIGIAVVIERARRFAAARAACAGS